VVDAHVAAEQSDVVAVEFGEELRTPDQRKNLVGKRSPAAEVLEDARMRLRAVG